MTDERGTVKNGGTAGDRRPPGYWKQTGVIPRWQFVLVYVLIVSAAAIGMLSLGHTVNENCVRIHRIVQAGDELLAGSRVSAQARVRWHAADCPNPPAPLDPR